MSRTQTAGSSATWTFCNVCDAPGSCADSCDQVTRNQNWKCVPDGWACEKNFFGDGSNCDCGCGALDSDCADATSASCDVCAFGCANLSCVGIDAQENWHCEMDAGSPSDAGNPMDAATATDAGTGAATDAATATDGGSTMDAAIATDAGMDAGNATTDAATDAGPCPIDAASCYCALSGLWAMRQAVTVSWPARTAGATTFVAAGSSELVAWELHEYVYDGSTLEVRKKGCGTSEAPRLCSPLYEEWYSSTLPTATFDALALQTGVAIALPAALPGDSFTGPTEAALLGLELADPLHDPWPATRDDVVNWTDDDADGVEGVMLWPRQTTEQVSSNGTASPDDYCAGVDPSTTFDYLPVGFESGTTTIAERAACVSVAMRVLSHLEGDIETCTRITGDVVEEATEGRVRDCRLVPAAGWDVADVTCSASDWNALPACSDGAIDLLDQQDQTHTTSASFELVKIGELGDSATCAAVRSTLP